jgi:hypothetical protein
MLSTSLRQRFANEFQFAPSFRGGLGIGHLQVVESVDYNSGNDQAGVLLIVGGNDIPR